MREAVIIMINGSKISVHQESRKNPVSLEETIAYVAGISKDLSKGNKTGRECEKNLCEGNKTGRECEI